jgi:hypothetical protein
MAVFSRYRSTPKLNLGAQYGTSAAIASVRNAIKLGIVPITQSIVLSGGQRLDHLAALYYQDSKFWWVLAAASDIGWGLQVPPGTVINVPDINAVATIIG